MLGYILKKCGFFQKPSGAVVEASVRYVRMCTGVRIPISANSAKIKSKVFLELAPNDSWLKVIPSKYLTL